MSIELNNYYNTTKTAILTADVNKKQLNCQNIFQMYIK